MHKKVIKILIVAGILLLLCLGTWGTYETVDRIYATDEGSVTVSVTDKYHYQHPYPPISFYVVFFRGEEYTGRTGVNPRVYHNIDIGNQITLKFSRGYLSKKLRISELIY
jgi:hypothetical protein